jgi:hypothetical protein
LDNAIRKEDAMNRAPIRTIPVAALTVLVTLAASASAPAQNRPESPTQRAAGSPPHPQVAAIGSDSNLVSAAANDHGAYLWIVDPVQHFVTLCEKVGAAKDFACSRKPLP